MNRRSLFKLAGFSLAGAALSTVKANAEIVATDIAAKHAGIPVPSAENPLLLNYNENAVGIAPAARKAIIDSLHKASRYPDAQRAALISALAKKHDMKETQVSLGNGSTENIQGIIQALVHAARENGQPVQLVVPDPTFNYAELYAAASGVKTVKVPLTQDMLFDIPALQQAAKTFPGVSIFYLCNPNNPTATVMPGAALAEWITHAPENQFFLIDEAYADFVTDPAFTSAIALVKKRQKNLAVTRTFSKLYALAGLRVGYALAEPSRIEQFEKFMSIDNTGLPGAVAALASLQDTAFQQRSLASVNQSRNIMTKALDELGIRYVPSQANFIFYQLKGDNKTYQQRMKEQHVLVGRPFPPLDNWNRLTLGTPEEMTVFVGILKQFREKGWV